MRGVLIDISETTIHCFLFSPEYQAPRTIAEYDYRLGQTKDWALMRDVTPKATLIRWIVDHIAGNARNLTGFYISGNSEGITQLHQKFLVGCTSFEDPVDLRDNTLTPNHVVLVPNIIVGYDLTGST